LRKHYGDADENQQRSEHDALRELLMISRMMTLTQEEKEKEKEKL
jgi:hypothetical protein